MLSTTPVEAHFPSVTLSTYCITQISDLHLIVSDYVSLDLTMENPTKKKKKLTKPHKIITD